MRRLCGLPFCGPVLEPQVALEVQLREIRPAFRHGSVAPWRIRVAIACPTLIALPRRYVLLLIIDLRDSQKACLGSSSRTRRVTWKLVMRNAGVSTQPNGYAPFALSSR